MRCNSPDPRSSHPSGSGGPAAAAEAAAQPGPLPSVDQPLPPRLPPAWRAQRMRGGRRPGAGVLFLLALPVLLVLFVLPHHVQDVDGQAMLQLRQLLQVVWAAGVLPPEGMGAAPPAAHGRSAHSRCPLCLHATHYKHCAWRITYQRLCRWQRCMGIDHRALHVKVSMQQTRVGRVQRPWACSNARCAAGSVAAQASPASLLRSQQACCHPMLHPQAAHQPAHRMPWAVNMILRCKHSMSTPHPWQRFCLACG